MSPRARILRDPAPSSGLRQLHFAGLLESMGERDAGPPAAALFAIAVSLLGLGLLLQAGYAATTQTPIDFRADFLHEARDRGLALTVLVAASHVGLKRLERFLPFLMSLAVLGLLAVWLPGIGRSINGSHRWISIGFSIQPSELARLVFVIWVAWYCCKLGSRLHSLRDGVLRMFVPTCLICGLVWIQPDKGGAAVLFACACGTMWVGGVDASKVATPFFALVVGAMSLAATADSYARRRIDMWLGEHRNEQVQAGLDAIASAGWFGSGFSAGELRNRGVSYMDSDLMLALIGEEFGLFGLALVLGLYCAMFWFAFRMVLSIRGRFEAAAAFGLCSAVAMQTLVHAGAVSGLIPPKGMTLPLLSDGGTSAIVSCLGLGLAIGAARASSAKDLSCRKSSATA